MDDDQVSEARPQIASELLPLIFEGLAVPFRDAAYG
jgi:hypothetical protein